MNEADARRTEIRRKLTITLDRVKRQIAMLPADAKERYKHDIDPYLAAASTWRGDVVACSFPPAPAFLRRYPW